MLGFVDKRDSQINWCLISKPHLLSRGDLESNAAWNMPTDTEDVRLSGETRSDQPAVEAALLTRNAHAITGVSIVKYAGRRRFVLAEVGIIATRP
jgi:hypothetical protein